MGDQGREAEQAIAPENRRQQHDVRQMGQAAVGIVGSQDIAGTQLAGEFRHQRRHHPADVSEMEARAMSLRDHPAARVNQHRGEVAGASGDRARRALHGVAHLVANRGQRVVDHFQQYRVGSVFMFDLSRRVSAIVVCLVVGFAPMKLVFEALSEPSRSTTECGRGHRTSALRRQHYVGELSSSARQPGGITTVVSNSSIIAGPVSALSSRLARVTTRAVISPTCGPK